ncbi:Chromo domain protein [Entamoeba marina]
MIPEAVVDKRKKNGVVCLLVKWKGLLPSENTWIPLQTSQHNVNDEITNTQLVRFQKGLSVIEIIGQYKEQEQYVLVRWSDQTCGYVTIDFLRETYPVLLFESVYNSSS